MDCSFENLLRTPFENETVSQDVQVSTTVQACRRIGIWLFGTPQILTCSPSIKSASDLAEYRQDISMPHRDSFYLVLSIQVTAVHNVARTVKLMPSCYYSASTPHLATLFPKKQKTQTYAAIRTLVSDPLGSAEIMKCRMIQIPNRPERVCHPSFSVHPSLFLHRNCSIQIS